ncbi:MAG: RagB/SusD family nutrient uptake outer membrane protein [Muribaculaceae bacterium]|nr:RagB/SusD family nutrient uptake outer membrane protein [Muribaculaceae bacterium]
MMWYGESMGQDYNNYFISGRYGNTWSNWQMFTSYRTYGAVMAWTYYYGLISQANNLIAADVPSNEEIKGEYAFRLAQAYTLRAHAYIKLHSLYGPRWEDSSEGRRHSVVLRTSVPDPDNAAKDVSSTNEVLKQIYDDLDRAIELYDLSNFEREHMWETNESVAYGLYARAALLKNDWPNAEKYAHLASEGYDVMTADEYTSGFAEPTSEWMWATQDGYTALYYASFGAAWACNGAYPCIWGSYGAGAINYTFYKEMQNTNDARCELYYTPDKEGRALRSKFWNEEDCEAASMNINIGENLPAAIQRYCDKMYDKIGKANGWVFPYNNDFFEGGMETDGTFFPFGAQFKFWASGDYSSSAVCLMRSSEMLLVEAEAACHNEHYTVAQDCLEKINKNRISNYTKSTKTGDELLAEIKLNRRWELWGEGFNWFDFKRWNEPIERIAWKPGDLNSGNWQEAAAKSLAVDEYDGWVFSIPYSEIDYNDAIGIDVNNPDYGM